MDDVNARDDGMLDVWMADVSLLTPNRLDAVGESYRSNMELRRYDGSLAELDFELELYVE